VKERLSQISIEAGNKVILESIDTLSVKTEAEIKAATDILLTLSEYILSSRIIMIPKKDFIDRLNTYIFSHISDKITVGDLCESFKFGKTHLYKLAAIYLNHSISDYIRNQRISYAKNLLKEIDTPIKEIATSVGFADYNYFSRCFKESTGMSARDYRTNLGH
jgi:AraC-like DNA-binding protein